MKTIRTWLDLESAESIPAHLHHHVRAYRVLQQFNRESASCSGRFTHDTAVSLLVNVLKLDKRRAKNVLKTGDGTFWSLDQRRNFEVVLTGWRRLCATLGILPAQGIGLDIPIEDIAGNISKFKGLIAAAKMQAMLYNKPHVEISRGELMRNLGVTLPTIRRYVQDGWLVRVPQVDFLGTVKEQPGLWAPTLKPNERLWQERSGARAIVRQTCNVYTSRFMADLLPERLSGMGKLVGARVTGYGGESYKWSRVPDDFKMGVFLPSKVSPNWAATAWA